MRTCNAVFLCLVAMISASCVFCACGTESGDTEQDGGDGGDAGLQCSDGEVTIQWPDPCIGVDGGQGAPETRSKTICRPAGCGSSPACDCFDEDPCRAVGGSNLRCMNVSEELIICGCG
jgi:hypothetical protein